MLASRPIAGSRVPAVAPAGFARRALHLAKETPDLLDTIRNLEFPERAAWIERAGEYDIPIPPAFDVTAYDFLQNAYIEDDPLKELLRIHRKLAVGRAPLKQRLEVLRKLAAADANSAIWSADIQVFEAARIEQLQGETAEACRSRTSSPE